MGWVHQLMRRHLLKYTIILSLQKSMFSSSCPGHGGPKVSAVLNSPQITE
jgi:hypothetical protein